MLSKVTSVLGAVILGIGILAGTTQGCGGGSSGTNIADLCTRGCQKTLSCLPAGAPPVSAADCQTRCTTSAMGSNGQSCTNESALVAKYNECIAKSDCTMFLSCLPTIPACQGGTTGTAGTGATGTAGTGATGTAGTGATGTAGTTGAAGTGSTGAAGFAIPDGGFPLDASAGSTCGTACVKAEACCKALPGANPANCMFVSQCNASSNQASAVQACNGVLTASTFFGAAQPAACK